MKFQAKTPTSKLTDVTADTDNTKAPTNISVSGTEVTVDASLLGTAATTVNVSITGFKPAEEQGGEATPYKIKLSGSEITLSTETKLWTASSGTLTYNTGGKSEGYVLKDGENAVNASGTAVTSITYTDAAAASTKAFAITGLATTVQVEDGLANKLLQNGGEADVSGG